MANVLNQKEKYCLLGSELDTTFSDLEAVGQILPSAGHFLFSFFLLPESVSSGSLNSSLEEVQHKCFQF